MKTNYLKLIFLILFLITLFSMIYQENHHKNNSEEISHQMKNMEVLKTNAFTPLSLNVPLNDQDISSGLHLNYSITLDQGEYLIVTENPYSSINLEIEISMDSNFAFINKSVDKYDIRGMERCFFNLTSTKSIYFRVSCSYGTGSFNIIISNDLNEGTFPLTLDNDFKPGHSIQDDEYYIFYITLNPGSYEIITYTYFDLDLGLNLSYDIEFKTISIHKNEKGYGGEEKINLDLSEQKTIYLMSYCIADFGFVHIIVCSGSCDTDKNNGNSSPDNLVFPWWIQPIIGGIISACAGIVIKIGYGKYKVKKYASSFIKIEDNIDKIENLKEHLMVHLGLDWEKIESSYTEYNDGLIGKGEFIKRGQELVGRKFNKAFDT